MTLRPIAPATAAQPPQKSLDVGTHPNRNAVHASPPPSMVYRKLGQTGLDVSVISLGSWVTHDYQIGVSKVKTIMQSGYEAGINFFDNAEAYAQGKSEQIMGQALWELGIPRSDVVLSTKIFFGSSPSPRPTARGLSRKHIVEGMSGSLSRLNVDHVDVIFAHRFDSSVPMEEIVRGFNHILDRGWAFYWGTSEWSPAAIEEAHDVATRLRLIPPCVEQAQYSVLHRKKVEMEYRNLCLRKGMGLTTFSPLACGLLSGKYSPGAPIPEGSRFGVERYKFLADRWLQEDKIQAAATLNAMASEVGVTSAQLALAWCISNPLVSTVITGATDVSHVKENVGALSILPSLTPVLKSRIETAIGSHSGVAMGTQPA
jgi:voltage-dependent potassium channel beta subunit